MWVDWGRDCCIVLVGFQSRTVLMDEVLEKPQKNVRK
jgi:hypothetical protein